MARFNFEGYKLSEWFKGNKTAIKEVVKVGLPLLTFWMATGSYWQTAAGTIVGKFALDAIHYYINK